MKFELFQNIMEQTNAAQARLTDTQKLVLVNVYAAATPEMAYDTVAGAPNTVAARNQLRSAGLIVVDDQNSRAGVTDQGQEALVNNNLIDESGQLTEEGNNLLQNTQQDKRMFTNEGYKIIDKL
ncbi:hypothetical protein [Stenotrophomonas phage RAS14]